MGREARLTFLTKKSKEESDIEINPWSAYSGEEACVVFVSEQKGLSTLIDILNLVRSTLNRRAPILLAWLVSELRLLLLHPACLRLFIAIQNPSLHSHLFLCAPGVPEDATPNSSATLVPVQVQVLEPSLSNSPTLEEPLAGASPSLQPPLLRRKATIPRFPPRFPPTIAFPLLSSPAFSVLARYPSIYLLVFSMFLPFFYSWKFRSC